MSRADVVIFGMPRSGTTLLASLLTVPGLSWCLVEPSAVGNIRNSFRERAKSFGFDLDGINTIEQLADALEKKTHKFELIRWGAKEVFLREFQHTAKAFDPHTVIFLIRDPRNACLSFKNHLGKPPWMFQSELGRHSNIRTSDLKTLVGAYAGYCRNVIQAHDAWVGRKFFLNYETLLYKGVRDILEAAIEWPLDGDPDQGKPDERRGGVFARKVLEDDELSTLIEAELPEFLSRFNYTERREMAYA